MKIGILGLGTIAMRVAEGIQYAHDATLYAVASRNNEHAEDFKNLHNASVSYGSYQELVEDSEVDLVYICTPNKVHYEHIMLCLKHEKHVLCEKPFVSTMMQLKECFAYAKQQNCFLMEAQKTIFTPLNQKIKQIIEEEKIGKLLYIEGSYGNLMDTTGMDEHHWAFSKEDGGSMYDIGVYPICYANYFASSPITEIQGIKKMAIGGYDEFAQAILRYDNGIIASVRSAWNMDMMNMGYLYGEKGYIITDKFWKNTEAMVVIDGKKQVIKVDMKSDFTGEIDHVVHCIKHGLLQSNVLSMEASIQIMKVLEYMKKKYL